MKRAAMIVLVSGLLLSGCGTPPPAARTVTGKVVTPAQITTYHPEFGTPCEPTLTDVREVTIVNNMTKVRGALSGGVVIYPRGDKPGGQWCEMTFTAQVEPGRGFYMVGVPGRGGGSIKVIEADLFGPGVGLVVTASGIEGGRL